MACHNLNCIWMQFLCVLNIAFLNKWHFPYFMQWQIAIVKVRILKILNDVHGRPVKTGILVFLLFQGVQATCSPYARCQQRPQRMSRNEGNGHRCVIPLCASSSKLESWLGFRVSWVLCEKTVFAPEGLSSKPILLGFLILFFSGIL